MASYFVACLPQADGAHAVHDRSRCPPRCFPGDGASEYLGEFLDAAQAIAVARLRYAHARGCTCIAPAMAPAEGAMARAALSALRT